MWQSFVEILREYPAIALFLTVGLGFLLGKIRIKSFSLGSVTAVLLVGVLVGQLKIPMSGPLKTVFFMLFLFSIGYSVGPKFFRSLKGMGLKQALFAILMGASCFGITLLISFVMGYSKGETVGLFSGSQTCSALIGLGSEAIGNLNISDAAKETELSIIPVCYAVTYIFGTLGTVIILGNLGPRLLGGLDKVKRETKKLEEQMDRKFSTDDPAYIDAIRIVIFRAYHVESPFFDIPKTVKETEAYFRKLGLVVYVDRIRIGDKVIDAKPDRTISRGNDIVVCGRREYIIEVEQLVGSEISDEEILQYPVECVPILIKNKGVTGKTIGFIREQPFMHGVMILQITRDGEPIEVTDSTIISKDDMISVIGHDTDVARASKNIGHIDRPSVSSDLMFVGLAIFIGGLIGAITFHFGSIPISFGTSGGALISGLIFGWLRSRRPTYGYIPNSALWLMNNLGLNAFIAVIGIEAGPSFVTGLMEVGPLLFVAGMVGTSVPLFFGLWLGHKVFKFHPALTLGCCAGTRTCTASLGAVQNALGSTLPAMGYTVTYAVSNILLVIWGLVTVLIV